MDADVVPIHKYDPAGHPDVDERMQSLVQSFKCKFGRQPDVIVRVPGRVNIIGEHIDYCGYPVFPMAIDRSILIAASRSDDDGLVRLCNTDDTLFPDFSCNVSAFSINQPPKWHDYFLCGLRGVLDSSGDSINSGRGLQALVDGSIPPAAGLSSSSALVCGSAVTCRILILNDHRIAKHEIASACSKFEQLIGTQGGGMDQAIQMLAEAGTAKFVQFFPELTATTVSLPATAVFFVSHSGVDCNKAASHHFNTRVLETKISALLIAKKMGAEIREPVTLSAVQRALKLQVTDMPAVVARCLRKQRYAMSEVLEELKLSSTADLMHELGIADGSRFDESVKSQLKLYDRASHVYEEAARVQEFRRVCEDERLGEDAKESYLAKLMIESHYSLQLKYQCSCRELDDLVQACRSAGAKGSRLTGAGWGGCCLSLVSSSRVPQFRERMQKFFPNDSFTFQTVPSAGTTVFELDSEQR